MKYASHTSAELVWAYQLQTWNILQPELWPDWLRNRLLLKLGGVESQNGLRRTLRLNRKQKRLEYLTPTQFGYWEAYPGDYVFVADPGYGDARRCSRDSFEPYHSQLTSAETGAEAAISLAAMMTAGVCPNCRGVKVRDLQCPDCNFWIERTTIRQAAIQLEERLDHRLAAYGDWLNRLRHA